VTGGQHRGGVRQARGLAGAEAARGRRAGQPPWRRLAAAHRSMAAVGRREGRRQAWRRMAASAGGRGTGESGGDP
jgi:hypothetical protein